VQAMIRTGVTIAILLGLPFTASSQIPEKEVFALHISKIKRVNEGCNVDAESTTVHFNISSEISAACGMLRAGETYKALRATLGKDPKDESKDAAILVIYNNTKNVRRDNAIFNIDSEEAMTAN
jgi:hypothetical protein